MKRTRRTAFVLSLMAMAFLTIGHAADDPVGQSGATELAKLKAQLEQQQKQIEQLSAMLAQQKKMMDHVVATGASAPATAPATPAAPAHMLPNLGEVASSTPMVPPAPPAPAPPRVRPASACRGSFGAAATQDWRCHHPAHRIHGFHGGVEERERRRIHRQQLRQRAVRQRLYRNLETFRVPLQPAELADRLPRRRQREGRAHHRLQRE